MTFHYMMCKIYEIIIGKRSQDIKTWHEGHRHICLNISVQKTGEKC